MQYTHYTQMQYKHTRHVVDNVRITELCMELALSIFNVFEDISATSMKMYSLNVDGQRDFINLNNYDRFGDCCGDLLMRHGNAWSLCDASPFSLSNEIQETGEDFAPVERLVCKTLIRHYILLITTRLWENGQERSKDVG